MAGLVLKLEASMEESREPPAVVQPRIVRPWVAVEAVMKLRWATRKGHPVSDFESGENLQEEVLGKAQ